MKNKSTKPLPRRQKDELLKAIIKVLFLDFLRLLYPKADDLFDFSEPIEFVDSKLISLAFYSDKKTKTVYRYTRKGSVEGWFEKKDFDTYGNRRRQQTVTTPNLYSSGNRYSNNFRVQDLPYI